METSNLERKPRAKDWARERDLGRRQAGRGGLRSLLQVTLCFFRQPRGAGGGLLALWEPRLDLPLEPFPEWLWDPPTKDLVGRQGERHSLAKSFQDPSLAAAVV